MSNEDIKRDFGKGSKQAQAVCFSQFRKGKKQSMKNLDLTFQVPIKENALFDNEFIIKGTAITSTITDNNHKFLPKELESAAETMKGIPLLVDHDNRVDAVIGRVKQGIFDGVTQNLEFEATVDDQSIQEKISRGLLDSVSIGATVEDVLEEDGIFTPIGIKIRELSIVAVPADDKAKFVVAANAPTFQMALQEAYAIGHPQTITTDNTEIVTHPNTMFSFSSDNNSDKQIFERGLVDMEKEEMTELKTQLAEQEAKLAEFEKKERSRLEAKYVDLCKVKNVDSIDVKEADNKTIELLVNQLSTIKEADVDEEPKDPEPATPEVPEEPKPDEAPEVVADKEDEEEEEEEVEEKGKYRIFQTSDSDMLKGSAFTVEFKQPVSSNYI